MNRLKNRFQDLLEAKYLLPEELRFDAPMETFLQVKESVADLILKNREINAYIEEFAGIPLFPKTSLDAILKSLAHGDLEFPKEDGNKSLLFLKDFMVPRIRFERDIYRMILDKLINISAVERALLGPSFDISDLFDQLFLDWYEAVVLPMDATLQTKSAEDIKDRFKELKLDHPLAVIAREDRTYFTKGYEFDGKGEMIQYALGAVFPETVNLISDKLDLSRAALPHNAAHFHDYLAKLRSALLCRKIDLLDHKWLAVEEAWARTPPKEQVLPVHGKCHRLDPIRSCPGFRLIWRLAQDSEKATRIKRAAVRLAQTKELKESAQNLGLADPGLCRTITAGGPHLLVEELIFQNANVPDIHKKGIKILMDQERISASLKKHGQGVKSLTSGTTCDWALDRLSEDLHFDFFLGQAMGQCFAVSDKLYQLLGMNPPLNSLKAVILGVETLLELETREENKEKAAKKACAMILGGLLCLIKHASLKDQNDLKTVGLWASLLPISVENDKIHLVPANKSFIKIIEPLFEWGNRVIKAYQALDAGALNQMEKQLILSGEEFLKDCQSLKSG